MDRRQFLRCAAGAFTVSSLTAAVAGCKTGIGGGTAAPSTGSGLYRFPQGLACGDPSPTSGVFWTRVVRGDGVEGDIPVTLELSRTPIAENDESFRLAMGIELVAKQSNDYVIHHKVTGLEPDTVYWYRFIVNGDWTKPTGRFRTLPSGEAEVSRTQFGVLNSIDWSRNHWEGMTSLKSNFRDMYYVLLMGGAIQELAPIRKPGQAVEAAHSELHFPDGLTVDGLGVAARTLADYRYLHQTYRTDARLQNLLSMFTLMPMVGDSDFSNDSWQAHETYTAANAEQRDRLLAALAVWMQYMPLDWGDVSYDPNASDFSSFRLYRNFRFGNLLNLLLTEQRLQRTDHAIPESAPHEPLGLTGSVGSRVLPNPAELARYSNSSQKIIGDGQMAWLKNEITKPGVVWNIIAGESPMSHVPLDLSGEPDFATGLRKEYLLSGDSWEGYKIQHTDLIDFIRLRGVRNVVSLASGGLFAASEIWSNYASTSSVMVECCTGPMSGLTLAEEISTQVELETDSRFDVLKRLLQQSYQLDNKIRPDTLGWLKYLNTGTRGYSVVYVLSNQLVIDFVKLAETAGSQAPAQVVASMTRVTIASGTLQLGVLELK